MSIRENIELYGFGNIKDYVRVLTEEFGAAIHPNQANAYMLEGLPFYAPRETGDHVSVLSFNKIPLPYDVKRALAERVRAGYAPGGRPPRGYLAKQEVIGTKRNGEPRIGSRWVIDPDLGPLAALAFRLRAEGKSLREITKATHDRLYRDKNSWTTFFRNRSYLGIGKCGGLEILDHHPALVDPATFKTVQEVNETARQNTPSNLLHPRRLASPSLLSGLASCLHCGAAMVKNRAGLNK